MSETITLHSFGTNDRSGKVRWLANELGLEITEARVKLGEHRQFPYRDLNPFAAIPTVQWRDQTLIESTAICTLLAEAYPERKLVVAPEEPARADYLKWMAICSDTLENRLVETTLASEGIMPPEYKALHERTLQFKLRITLEQMPKQGFIVADRFTLADITLAYSLRLAIGAGLIEFADVAGYLEPLMAREAAQKAEFFSSLKQ
ncbi:glutathione S-transferase family protein [Reinekea blandensis]|uniref:Glutathione S-transferase n=1 Tax=Reinekea blandensis MED297 TaxID=314283 RepID=A4BHT6_9GAMM|nr:glutathione S-transferase family protein [Reinekea blandensis]EAR08341.1 glutathione S-transferase [Reinekea sp. MED297] [Reinekea blandensis MED297]